MNKIIYQKTNRGGIKMNGKIRKKGLAILLILAMAISLIPITTVEVSAITASKVYVNSETGNDTTGDGTIGSPYKTFHKGYFSAAEGDTLDLTGTFTWTDPAETGDTEQAGYEILKDITIQGHSGQTIIQAAGSENTADRRVFSIGQAEPEISVTVNLINLEIRYGKPLNPGDGGGIRASKSTLTITNCYIHHNRARQGVGIDIFDSSMIMNNSTVSDNTSTASQTGLGGGGILVNGYRPVTITNSTIFNNTNVQWGGGIHFRNSATNILTNCTIANNSSSDEGGGTSIEKGGSPGLGTLILKNTIIANNTSINTVVDDLDNLDAVFTDNGYNIIEFTNAATAATTMVGDQDSLNLSAALGGNDTITGTPTLSLQSGSIAINAGDSMANGSVSVPTTDQRGLDRIGTVDIGAYEFGAIPILPPTVTTSDITTYTSNTAAMGGSISADGGAAVTERGVVYSSTDMTPTIGEAGVIKNENGTGTGSFSESIDSLTPGTTYYVQAYAENIAGTNYGGVKSFTTQATATAPSSIVLAAGSSNPVGGVTNVAIPAAGGTDSTGAVTGWVGGTNDRIKLTVTDGGSAASAITINGASYTSGADYTIGSAASLTVVVTTSEAGRLDAVRTFTIAVTGAPAQTTPTFSPAAGAVTWGTAVTISSAGADAIYYTTDGSDPTTASTNQATTPLVVNAVVTVKAIAVKAGLANSEIAAAAYTQATATAPSSIVLAAGSSNPVGGVTNVAIPAAGGTDSTGAVTGWVGGTNDRIKLTVTDGGSAASAITINGASYTSGADYTIGSAASLTVVVTTSEAGRLDAVRTFTIAVTGAPAQTTPTFSPAAGAVTWGTAVTISSAGADAIYYTTDGSDPTTASTNQATTPLVVNAVVTVKAIAVKAGLANSEIAAAAYTQATAQDLTNLIISDTPSNFTFAANTYTYPGLTVANGISSITVVPTGTGTITIDGVAVASGSTSGAIALTAGVQKSIEIVVTEPGKAVKTYTINITRAAASGSSSGSNNNNTSAGSTTAVIVNGQSQDAGTTTTSKDGDKTVTTVTLDDKKIQEKLNAEGTKATVSIPISGNADIGEGVLNGQTVKSMEEKEAVLEIKTGSVSYTLPASEINISDVSAQLGEAVQLKDIKISVRIAEPPADTVRVVQDTANQNNYQIVVKPVEFEITCTSGEKTVTVSKFNGYVERTVAIPDGVDPSKITTGIVLNADGTFSHVPTTIIKIDGKYYAKINSLTNSTYSVIYNPIEFADVAKHWAKDSINAMGSRLIVSGSGNGNYSPNKEITRAEFAAIVIRALGLKAETTESRFTDVKASSWYEGYVETAISYGIITGYSNGKFGPNDKITREQAMTMIARAMKLTGLYSALTEAEMSAQISSYADGASSSKYAKEGIATCLKTGVVSGKSSSRLAPKDYITRAEVAVIIERMLKKSKLI